MIRAIVTFVLSGTLAAATGTPLWGQDKDPAQAQVTVQGSLSAGIQAVGETARSSKFTEYRDVPRGTFVEGLDLGLASGRGYLRLAARDLGRADQSVWARLGRHGAFRLDLGYEELPHRFSFFGATPYVERSPGVFTLNDVIRSAAEALVPTGTSTNIAAARALVSSFLASAAPVDLGHRRRTARLDLVVTPGVPWSFRVSAERESRGGSRPYGAPLGFSNAIELPEPIRYTTTNLSAGVEYHRAWGTLRAGVAASFFANDVQTLVWDNPYRITDSTYAQAYISGNGTALGRSALWPSNDAVRFTFGGTFKPLAGTRFTVAAAYSSLNQNEPLLPFTINTALPGSDPNAAGALQAPRETAGARTGVASLDLTVRSRLAKSLTLTAGVRYYDLTSRMAGLAIPTGYARIDQVWEAVPVAIEPYSFSRLRLFGDLTLRPFRTTSVTVGYSAYAVRRHEASREGQRDRNDEGTFRISADSAPVDWLQLRLSFSSSERDWTLDDTFVAYVPGFAFKRYFEASRDRRTLNAQVGLSPLDALDIQLSYGFGHDDYPRSAYGLLRDDFDTYGLDATYAVSKEWSIFGFYAREVYETDQAARQSGSTFSTNPSDDWTAGLKDSVGTWGAGQGLSLLKQRLGLDLSASRSKAAGSSALASPAGGTPDQAVNFTDPLDTTSWWTLRASLKWKVRPNLTVVLGYWYERYDLEDIVRNDVAVDYASAGAVFLGALEPGYEYHVGSLRLVYTW